MIVKLSAIYRSTVEAATSSGDRKAFFPQRPKLRHDQNFGRSSPRLLYARHPKSSPAIPTSPGTPFRPHTPFLSVLATPSAILATPSGRRQGTGPAETPIAPLRLSPQATQSPKVHTPSAVARAAPAARTKRSFYAMHPFASTLTARLRQCPATPPTLTGNSQRIMNLKPPRPRM